MQSWGVRAYDRAKPWREPAIPPMGWIRNNTLLEVTNSLGLSTNRQLILDAGDSASYTSGQSWLDRSGNGFDFFLGATGAAAADDPTFNGTAGAIRSTEYFSGDGGDNFRYDTTNETWMENIHKNSAVFTLLAWMYLNTTTGVQSIAGTNGGGGAETGFQFDFLGTNTLRINIKNAGTTVLTVLTTATISDDVWTFVAVALDEAAATGTLQMNATQESFTSTYTSPSALAASQTMEICARGNGVQQIESGSRVAMFGAWSSKLTDAQLTSIYTATRSRFGV